MELFGCIWFRTSNPVVHCSDERDCETLRYLSQGQIDIQLRTFKVNQRKFGWSVYISYNNYNEHRVEFCCERKRTNYAFPALVLQALKFHIKLERFNKKEIY